MNRNEMITELKKEFKNIYEDFGKRRNRGAWRSAVTDAYERFPEETAKVAAGFVLSHPLIPAACVRSLLQAVDLRNRTALLSDLYTEELIRGLCKRMSHRDPARYEYLPEDLTDEQLILFFDAVREARQHLKRHRLYLAEKSIGRAEAICAGHPDLALMRARICCSRYDFMSAERIMDGLPSAQVTTDEAYELAGDICMAKKLYPQAYTAYRKARELSGWSERIRELEKKTGEAAARANRMDSTYASKAKEISSLMEEGLRFERAGDKTKAMLVYQQVIAEDYKQFEVYDSLSKILLERGTWEEADYLAEILLNFDAMPAKANLIKGRVLEAQNHLEDALFYYNAAVAAAPDDEEADCYRRRLTAILEGDLKTQAEAEKALSELEKAESRPVHSSVALFVSETAKEKQIDKISSDIDDLLQRGRMTEAYYDLMKKQTKYQDAPALLYKKAVILYLMNRDIEARKILCTLRDDDVFAQRASDFILDIDCRIADENRVREAEENIRPEILFHAKKYEQCLKAIGRVRKSKMTPELTALRGRCEIALNRFADALKSLTDALEENENLKEIRILKGMILQSKGDYENALEIYSEALERGEDATEICSLKASLLYQMERSAELLLFRSEAEQQIRRGSDADGYAGLVYMKRTTQDVKTGLKFLERAISAGSRNAEFYTAAAEAYFNERKYYSARRVAEAGLSVIPDCQQLFILKAEILFSLKKYDAAQMTAGTVLSEMPQTARLHYLLGRIESDRGNGKDALKWMRSAYELESENHTYVCAYADKCFEDGDGRTAEKMYAKAIELDPGDNISRKRRAILRKERGDDEDAIADIKAALEIEPEDAEAYVILGNIVSMYDIEETAEDLEDTDTDLQNASVASGLSIGSEAAGRPDGEEGRLVSGEDTGAKSAASMDADPDDDGADGGNGMNREASAEDFQSPDDESSAEDIKPDADILSGEQKRDENDKNDKIERNEGNEEVRKNWKNDDKNAGMNGSKDDGMAQKTGNGKNRDESGTQQGEEDDIESALFYYDTGNSSHEMLEQLVDEFCASPEFYFNKAISIDPYYRQSYISLAKYKAENGENAEALSCIEKAIELNPEMTDGYMVRGIILHLTGDNEAALRDFRRIVEKEPDNLRAYSYISKCCNASGRYEEAVEASNAGLRVNSDYVNLYVNRGVALYHLGQYEDAIEAFRKVITNQNSVNTAAVESAYRFRGMSYEKVGNSKKALSDYQKFLRYNPDRQDIKRRVRELEIQMEETKPKSRLSSIFHRK